MGTGHGMESGTIPSEKLCPKVEGLLARLTQASEQAAEGAPPAEPNNVGERLRTSVPPLGRTMYRFTTPQDSACGKMPVWPGDGAA